MNPQDVPYPLTSRNPAPGWPGATPFWARADKQGLGTAVSWSSQVWFTISAGVITELYYPDIDTPQIRDLQFLVTDGSTFFHDPQVDYTHKCELIDPNALGYRITNTATNPGYVMEHEVISESGAATILIRTKIKAPTELLQKIKVYALLAPHLEGFGAGNSGYVANTRLGAVLTANRNNTWLAMGANHGFAYTSCGFVGETDGWQDIIGHRRLPQFNYDSAINGNIALTGEVKFEINAAGEGEFVLAVAFAEGDPGTPNGALVALSEALSWPFSKPASGDGHLETFIKGWKSIPVGFTPGAGATGDGGKLFTVSRNVLLAHEDKKYSGALVASLSTPWGETRGDSDGGYHLVWPRDMSQSATALLAAGERDLPLRGLMYLGATQKIDGSWFQNFFITGKGHWTGVQLDEYSFPIILAQHLKVANALQGYDPLPMILAAAGALINGGPTTPQERWEENSGYSPSTLAANIAALVCAADFASAASDSVTANFLLEYADFLESHLEAWTVTNNGELLPEVKRHYIRILPPAAPGEPENPDTAWIQIHNRDNVWRPARNVVDGGFLELVRYGIRSPQDPIIQDSVKVIDAVLKDNLPQGPCYRRYNEDGYGQQDNGAAFDGVGVGRPWPLLMGERAHYALAAGQNISEYVSTYEKFAGDYQLIAEQLWNAGPVQTSTRDFVFGGPTGSSMPLAWAHAEYIKLVRSVSDGKVFDRLDVVADRYLVPHQPSLLEVWNFNRQIGSIPNGKTLRIQAPGAFRLHWSNDNWATIVDTQSIATALGVYYVDITSADFGSGTVRFTFFWADGNHWEGRDFAVSVR